MAQSPHLEPGRPTDVSSDELTHHHWDLSVQGFLSLTACAAPASGTPLASSSLSTKKKAANALSHPSELEKRKRKILSFLLYTLQPQGLSNINTQRKTFCPNGNNSQTLKFKLMDPDSTHNGHGWNELISPRGVV